MATRIKGDSDFATGRTGLANLVRVSATKARVEFHPNEKTNEKEVTFNVEVTLDGENPSVPSYVPFKLMKDGSKIALHATMDEAGGRIMYAKPASGYFTAKFDKFVSKGDAAPAPETKPGKNGGKPYRDFGALIEITDGMWNNVKIREGVWKGAKYFFKMYDCFAEGEGGGLAVKGAGSGSDNLADFLDAVVGGGEDIPFSENPLPAIQDLAQAQDRSFEINVAKGWIASITVPLALDAEDEIGFLGDAPETTEAPAEKEIPVALQD